jgi:hypothetical protein
MARLIRYLCPTCRQVAKLPNVANFAFCPGCGQALASFDRLSEDDARAKEPAPVDRGEEPAYGTSLPRG